MTTEVQPLCCHTLMCLAVMYSVFHGVLPGYRLQDHPEMYQRPVLFGPTVGHHGAEWRWEILADEHSSRILVSQPTGC